MTIQYFVITNKFVTSKPYLETVEALKSNENIQEIIWKNFEVTKNISGDLTNSDVYFNFAIKGKNKKIRIYSKAVKIDGDNWEITELTFKQIND